MDFCSPAVDNGDVTVEGTNGFGNLLAEDISQDQTDLEEQAAVCFHAELRCILHRPGLSGRQHCSSG